MCLHSILSCCACSLIPFRLHVFPRLGLQKPAQTGRNRQPFKYNVLESAVHLEGYLEGTVVLAPCINCMLVCTSLREDSWGLTYKVAVCSGRTGGLSTQMIAALAHASAHLTAAILSLVLLELGVETCIRCSSVALPGTEHLCRASRTQLFTSLIRAHQDTAHLGAVNLTVEDVCYH